MNLELIISDLDGTIVETEDYHRLAYNALFKELGLSNFWSKQDYIDRLQIMGGNKFREVFSWLNLPEKDYSEIKEKLYQRKTKLYADMITNDLSRGKLSLRPGVARIFGEIQEANIPLAIATACVGWVAENVIESALGKEFLRSLVCICGGETVKRQKPNPEIYLLTAAKAGIKPCSCVVFEDTAHGLEAAKSAGMTCVVTPSEYAREHDFSKADLVVETLDCPRAVNLEVLRNLLA